MAHLTSEQRYTIECCLANGKSRKEISLLIGKDKSVISRELKRNADGRNGVYKSALAQKKYRERLWQKPKRQDFSLSMRQHVDAALKCYLSPEQIVGDARKQGKAMVSHERLYQYIWADKKKGGDLYTYLRHKSKRYRHRGHKKDKRGQIVGRIGIEHRPAIVEDRKRFGDLEIDTIIGKDHKGAIVTINDRATGYLKMRLLDTKEAQAVYEATIDLLKDLKPYIHTITSDNGKEFALHDQIRKELCVDFFFARPYHSWERGSNENLNGLIRQFIPKKTDFSTLKHEDIQAIENTLNNRPRKRFAFHSPAQQLCNLVPTAVAFVT